MRRRVGHSRATLQSRQRIRAGAGGRWSARLHGRGNLDAPAGARRSLLLLLAAAAQKAADHVRVRVGVGVEPVLSVLRLRVWLLMSLVGLVLVLVLVVSLVLLLWLVVLLVVLLVVVLAH